MARYFFNLRYGAGPDKLAVDQEGNELTDTAAAWAYALEAAADLIGRTHSHGVRDWFACAFEIVDEAGEPVLTVPFSDTVPNSPNEEAWQAIYPTDDRSNTKSDSDDAR